MSDVRAPGAVRPWRVVHVDTERGWRGGERQALWLARGLAERGHGTIVAARSGEPLAARATEAGLRVARCDPRFEADPLAALRLRGLLRETGADVLHAHTAHAAGLGAIATLGTGVSLVVARRVDFPLKRNAGTRWKYARAAAVIAVSRAVAAIVEAGGVPGRKVHVVPDATDVHRRVAPADGALLAKLGVRAGAPLVVQVAQLVGHKDPLTLVRAMAHVRARVPAAQALLVGDGPLMPAVRDEIARLDLAGTVLPVGYRMDADRLLAAADVATLSSREEGMGSVMIDASLFGRAIAATAAGGIPEVVVDGETGLLSAPEDPPALAESIARLLLDRALAARLGASAARRVAEFTVERMVDRTLAVYESVLASGRGG